MPIHCPFHAEREFLWHPQSITDQEHQQTSNSICPYCGAKFSDPKILTEHWDQEHRYQHYLKKIKQDPLVWNLIVNFKILLKILSLFCFSSTGNKNSERKQSNLFS